jgi:hypothetical protein
MEKSYFSDDYYYEWSADPLFRTGSRFRNRWGNSYHKGAESAERETPKQMIRALQGIFCKGRYQSWRPWMSTVEDHNTKG